VGRHNTGARPDVGEDGNRRSQSAALAAGGTLGGRGAASRPSRGDEEAEIALAPYSRGGDAGACAPHADVEAPRAEAEVAQVDFVEDGRQDRLLQRDPVVRDVEGQPEMSAIVAAAAQACGLQATG
jgi:hypothetical protein